MNLNKILMKGSKRIRLELSNFNEKFFRWITIKEFENALEKLKND